MYLREYFLQLFHSISLQLKLQVYSISENKVICVKYVVFYFKIIFFFPGFIVLCTAELPSVIKIASIMVDGGEVM